jgi:glycosyltransferase involved in cell wall biosynthesis
MDSERSLLTDVPKSDPAGTEILKDLRVAIVHYWFMSRRGGERTVEALAEIFPQADIYTLVANPDVLGPELRKHRLFTSFLQRLPGVRHYHRHLLPLYPLALEQFDLTNYDLVISSESGPAKGVITSTATCHICYCHSPMRYLWDMYHSYRNGKGVGTITRILFSLITHYVRMWDLATASRVDYFATNCHNVAERIRKHYRREATVVYAPAWMGAGRISETTDDYYLVIGQMVDYKRIDLAIEACNRLGRPLRIIGDGEQYKRLRSLAGPTVQFLGSVGDEAVRENYARCRALLFPGEEDFGSVPVEAQSFGRPVVAYGRGGVLETILGFFPPSVEDPERYTGVFFRDQNVDSLVEAILALEKVEHRLSPQYIKRHAELFSAPRFKEDAAAFIAEKVAEFRRHGTARVFAAGSRR